MKAKEAVIINTLPSTSIMRSRLLKAFENENDADFIQSMYICMLQMRNEQQAEKSTKHSLSELKGILAFEGANDMSYDEMRMADILQTEADIKAGKGIEVNLEDL